MWMKESMMGRDKPKTPARGTMNREVQKLASINEGERMRKIGENGGRDVCIRETVVLSMLIAHGVSSPVMGKNGKPAYSQMRLVSSLITSLSLITPLTIRERHRL